MGLDSSRRLQNHLRKKQVETPSKKRKKKTKMSNLKSMPRKEARTHTQDGVMDMVRVCLLGCVWGGYIRE
jgi:hypothetical protein